MIVVEVHVENAELVKQKLDEIRSRMRSAIIEGLKEAAKGVVKEAKQLVPVRTGTTRKSIRGWVSRKELTGYVGSDWYIARFLECGTGMHEVRIKNKKVLSDGENIYGKHVTHPGIRPRPYLEPAVEKNIDFVRDTITRHIRKMIDEVIS